MSWLPRLARRQRDGFTGLAWALKQHLEELHRQVTDPALRDEVAAVNELFTCHYPTHHGVRQGRNAGAWHYKPIMLPQAHGLQEVQDPCPVVQNHTFKALMKRFIAEGDTDQLHERGNGPGYINHDEDILGATTLGDSPAGNFEGQNKNEKRPKVRNGCLNELIQLTELLSRLDCGEVGSRYSYIHAL